MCEVAVNCAGMWGREVGKWAGVDVPLHAAEHFYIITEPIAGLTKDLPTLRDPGGYTYYREEVGAILAGFFEPKAKPWGMKGIPDHEAFIRLPEDWAHLDVVFDAMAHRMPVTENAGIHTFFNGPEAFTPDDAYHLGEAPELKNFYIAAGFNSIGIQSSGGAGKVLAEWIVNGHPPMDLWDVDIRRNMPFQNNHRYLHDRTTEGLGLLYDMHWPFKQYKTSRGVRKTTLHDRLVALNACFGTAAGWERPNWFAPEGVEPKYEYSYGRQNWFDYSGEEHKATRETVGLFDQSAFAKYRVEGRDALPFLNRVCGNQIDMPIGKVAYTAMLNVRGGIEADVTVTRTGATEFMVFDAAASQNRTFNWLKSQVREDEFAVVTDVTSGYGMLGLMGPNSRAVLSELTDADLSNEAFPFGTSQVIDLAYARVRATRMTYVGELGWEISMPTEFTQSVFDAIVGAGAKHGLKHCGYHALNSLRIEKGYRHWGHDITDEDTPVEAGLSFAVAFDKGDFNGRERLLQQKQDGVPKRLVLFALDDPDPLLYHNEPVYRNGVIVGHLTSGMFGYTVGSAIGVGYVNRMDGIVTRDWVDSGTYEIEVATKRYPARASLRPFYDPKSLRPKS
jgi:4-methylaminobutanoate oxidase (formaldehyde-forming)